MNWGCGYSTAVSSATAVGLPLPCYTSTALGGALTTVCLWALHGWPLWMRYRRKASRSPQTACVVACCLRRTGNATKPFRQRQNPASRQRGSQRLSGAGHGAAADVAGSTYALPSRDATAGQATVRSELEHSDDALQSVESSGRRLRCSNSMLGNLQRNQRIGASTFGLPNDLGGIQEDGKAEDR